MTWTLFLQILILMIVGILAASVAVSVVLDTISENRIKRDEAYRGWTRP